MLFDTDVLIWLLRGNESAARLIETTDDRNLSVVTYMELLQGARNKQEIRTIRKFLTDFSFVLRPLTENIGHRASVYMEEYSLKGGMCVADALIASTAAENRLTLSTANRKHYKMIKDIEVKVFRP